MCFSPKWQLAGHLKLVKTTDVGSPNCWNENPARENLQLEKLSILRESTLPWFYAWPSQSHIYGDRISPVRYLLLAFFWGANLTPYKLIPLDLCPCVLILGLDDTITDSTRAVAVRSKGRPLSCHTVSCTTRALNTITFRSPPPSLRDLVNKLGHKLRGIWNIPSDRTDWRSLYKEHSCQYA